jgi:hypothetical protein
MRSNVELFIVPAGRPADPPGPPMRREIEAVTRDGLRDALRAQLEAEGYRVRAISFGPVGLVAYAEGRA